MSPKKHPTRKKLYLFAVSLLIQLCSGQRKILEKDNIAVEQHGSPFFAVPAPGIRFAPQVINPKGNNIDDFVGNLLPLQPRQSMPNVIGLDVSCYSERMVVSIVFDQPFNGMIYSKGFYGVQDCTYLRPNSGQQDIRFEIIGQGCGLQYIEPPGQPAYMENVVIIQNEPGIQEVWDTARGLRCLFDGGGEARSKQTVSAALNVAMLEQQVVTFSTDARASASMDIQVGRGPLAPSASGLVKIGELMTMVVAVEGPAHIDLLVRQCIAHDGTNDNTVDLTDQNGCVLKRKIIGSWQKKRYPGQSGSPVVSYAHFQAFKFPDKMDVYIECEVDLCNGECPVCPEDESNYTLRKRRSLPRTTNKIEIPTFEEAIDELEAKAAKEKLKLMEEALNETENAALRLARRLRVLSPDDISINGDEFSTFTVVTKTPNGQNEDDVCMSLISFVSGIVAMLIILITSSILTAVLCIRVRTIPSSESSFPPDSSFHAFSTVSGKKY